MRGAVPLSSYAFLAMALLMNAAANILIKYSMSHGVSSLFTPGRAAMERIAPFLSWPYLLGIFCFAGNLICYSLALRNLKLSLAYPLMVGVGYLVILGVEILVFGERLTTLQFAGIILILSGVWFVVR